MTSSYLRYVALGDSTTVGIGDPVPGPDGRQVNRLQGRWRGWARLLAESLASSYDLSFLNLATSGATTSVVRRLQLDDALAHRPDLLTVAARLDSIGTTLLTARFHDHGTRIGLPAWLSRPMSLRIAHVNAVYDEVHARHGALRLDLAACPDIHLRECWSIDRFHPSEIGHRSPARAFGELLCERGYDFELTSAEPAGGIPSSWTRDLGWMVIEGAPWFGRRARDLGPWAARRAISEVRRVAPGHRVPVG